MLLTESLHSVVLVEMVADTMGETFKINSKTKKKKKTSIFILYIIICIVHKIKQVVLGSKHSI